MIERTNSATFAYERYEKIIADIHNYEIKHADAVQQTRQALEDAARAQQALQQKQMAQAGTGAAQSIAKQASEEAKQLAISYEQMGKAGMAAAQSIQKSFDTAQIKETADAYNQLVKAQREYLDAYKHGDLDKQEKWASEIDNAKKLLESRRQEVEQLKETSKVREEVIKITNKATEANEKFNKTFRDTKNRKGELDEKKEIQETAEAYRRLQQAQKEYLDAYKHNDEAGKAHWQAEMDSAKETLRLKKEKLAYLDPESKAYQKIAQ